MRAVLDTNVLVSGLLVSSGHPADILRAWRIGRYQLVTSSPLLEELIDVLFRPRVLRRLPGTLDDVATFIADFARSAIVVTPTSSLNVIADPSDNRLLEAAIAGHADYIVSGDRDVVNLDQYQGIQVVTPARFDAILSTEPPGR